MRQDSGMRVENQIPRLLREDSMEPLDMIFFAGKNASLDRSSSQSVSSGKSTPPKSVPGAAGKSKKHRSGLPSRRVSASQPVRSSRTLRPRNGAGCAPHRVSSVIQPSAATDSLVTVPGRILLGKPPRKVSAKRKLEVPEETPRARKNVTLSLSEKSENTSASEPLPGRTSDGKIDYRYYITKYLNQKRSTNN